MAKKHDRVHDLIIGDVIQSMPIEISQESFSKLVSELIDNAFRFSESGQKVKVEFSFPSI